ncbi:hypothetical protein AVEN_12553-1 [Araneus ventricosus]|uniref:Uncharacterized protein n=1 Tax=Araneus ventricosus TaxID=182803 RepID=A0A4Y2AC72_ARAVE|nr:hypothetical protein AVEN_12553-1 [Araneus ventricosus]
MAVLSPLGKRLLQSRESDANAKINSSSLSEEDALEYGMSEDLEDSSTVISPPPSSKPEKANKYKTRVCSRNSAVVVQRLSLWYLAWKFRKWDADAGAVPYYLTTVENYIFCHRYSSSSFKM